LIVSVVIVAIVAAGVGTYLYITYSQKPTQQTTNVITNKTFTLALLDPKSGLYATGTAYILENNFLQKYAPNIKIVTVGGGSGAVVRTIQSGQAQLGIINTFTAIISISKGVPITIIATLKNPFLVGAFVAANSGINNVTQLKGKTFTATTVGSATDIFAKTLAAMMNWTIGKDVKIVYVGTSESELIPVVAGQTDATIIYFESGYPYVLKGVLKFIPLFNESAPGEVLVGDKNYIMQNPDTVKAVLKGLSEGFAAYMQNKDNSSINFIMRYYSALNLTFDEAKKIFQIQKWYTHFVIPVNLLDNELKLLQKFNVVPKNVTVDMFYTSQFVPVVNATPDQLYLSL